MTSALLLTTLLANWSDVSPSFLRDWIIVLCAFVGMLWMLKQFAASFAPKKPSSVILSPDPLHISTVEPLATKAELEAISARIEADIKQLNENALAGAIHQEGRIIAIHNRTNKFAESVESIRGQLTEIAQNQRLLMQKFLK